MKRNRKSSGVERCMSPLNPRCGSERIKLYIMWKGRRLPICESCWRKIAESDLEW